jgi:replicative superfamily II helicase
VDAVLLLKEEKEIRKEFIETIKKTKMDELCSKVFISKSQWRKIMMGCTRDYFFLCSEEIKAFPDIVLTLKEFLPSPQQQAFIQSEACRLLTEE